MCVIFPGVVRKATAHVDKSGKYASQNSIFVGIPQHQKGYLVYVPSTRKIIFSYDVVFYESFSSLLEYTSQHYSEVMDMRPAVTYTPYATYLKEQTDDIIMFIHFEQGDLLYETHENAESRYESDDDSIMSPLIRKE